MTTRRNEDLMSKEDSLLLLVEPSCIRGEFERTWNRVLNELEDSKERDKCIQRLEAALYWANKSTKKKD